MGLLPGDAKAGVMTCPVCRGQQSVWHFVPNISRLFGLEEMWYMKPLRKGIQAYTPRGWPCPSNKYMEWPGKPYRPITEREVGYFGEDVFDYEDRMSEHSWRIAEEEFERKIDKRITKEIQISSDNPEL